MQTHFTDLDKINLDDLEKYLVRKGWKMSNVKFSNRHNQSLKKGKAYSKNNHELLLIDPSYSDYQQRLSDALETLLCVEEIELFIKFKFSPKTIPFHSELGFISGEDVQKLLTN